MNTLTQLTKINFFTRITTLTLLFSLCLLLFPPSTVFAEYISKNTDTVEGMEEYIPTEGDLEKKINLSLTVSRVSFKAESGIHKYEIFYKGKNFPRLVFSSSGGESYILTTGEETFNDSFRIVKGSDFSDSWSYICVYLNSFESTEWICDITPGTLTGFIFTENEIPDIVTESDTSAYKTNVLSMIAWGMSGNGNYTSALISLLFPDKVPYIPYIEKQVDYSSLITIGVIFGCIFLVLIIGYAVIRSKQNKKIKLQKEAERIKDRKRRFAEEDRSELIRDLQAINTKDIDDFKDYPPIKYKQYLRLDPPEKEKPIEASEPKPVPNPVTPSIETGPVVLKPVKKIPTVSPETNISRPAWLEDNDVAETLF